MGAGDARGAQRADIGWLDEQPEKSVLYVCFGNRTAMSRAQIRELGSGLEKSGCRFLWVVKSAKVDREDAMGIDELLGEELLRRVEKRGLIVKEFVEQEVILDHRAVAGFMSHCGWNSVVEAAVARVRMIGWPRIGDQRVNARLLTAEEISAKVREVMGDEKLAETAAKVRAEALATVEEGGSSDQGFCCLVEKL